MADEGGGNEKIGGIEVEVAANMESFDAGMARVQAAVDKKAGYKIVADLKLAGSLKAAQRTIDIIARWQAGTLTSLQDKLAARHFSVAVKSATLSAEAIASLRRSVDDALSGYQANIKVTASITGVDSSGGAVKLSGVQFTGSAAPVASAATPAGPAAAGRPASAASAKRGARGAATAAVAPAPVTTQQDRAADAQKELDKLKAMLAKAQTAQASNQRLSPAVIAAAREITYRTSAINRPELNPEWARTVMGLDTGKPLSGGRFLKTGVLTGIRSGIEASIAGSMAAHRRVLAMRKEEEDAGIGGDLSADPLFRSMQGRRGQHGKSKGRAKYGAVYGKPDTRTTEEALAEQWSGYWAPYEPAARPEGPTLGVDALSEGYFDAQARGGSVSARYISQARKDLKSRLGNDAAYRRLGRQVHRRQERNIGGEVSPEEREFLAIQGLAAQQKEIFGPEAIAGTVHKRSMGGVRTAGFATEAAARAEELRSTRQLGKTTYHWGLPAELDESDNPIPGTGGIVPRSTRGARRITTSRDPAKRLPTRDAGNNKLVARALASLGITSNEPVAIPEDIIQGTDYARKMFALYGEKGTQGAPVRRALREARNAEQPYQAEALEARRAVNPKARLSMENIEAYRQRAVSAGALTGEQADLLNLYQGKPITRGAVKAFRAGRGRAEPLPDGIAPTQIPLATVARETQEQKAAEGVVPIAATSGSTAKGGGIQKVHVVNFSELNKLLTGQTQQGALARLFKGTGATTAKGTKVAGDVPPPSPEELQSKFGLKPEDAADLSTAMGGPAPKKVKGLKRARLGASSFEMTEGGGFVFDPDVEARKDALKEAARKQAAENWGAAADTKYVGEVVAGARTDRISKEAETRKVKADARKADSDKRAAAKTDKANEPTPAAAPRTLSAYFREQGQQYTAPRSVREVKQTDPVEAALEKAQIASTKASFPERAPSIAFGQVFARAIGFKTRYQAAQGELSQRTVTLDQTRTELAAQEIERQGAKEQITKFREITKERREAHKLTIEDKEEAKSLGQVYAVQTKHAKATAVEIEKQTAGVNKAREAVEKSAGPAEMVGNIASLFVGAKLFTTALTLASVGIAEIGKAVAPEIDRLMGFISVTSRVTKALGEQTKAMGGNADAAIATAQAQAGLSGASNGYISAALKPATTAKAGAQTFEQAQDLLRASFAGGAPQGLYGGYGGVGNTGFLAGLMGGGKGFTETVAGMTTDAIQRFPAAVAPENGGGAGKGYYVAPRSSAQVSAEEESAQKKRVLAEKGAQVVADTVTKAYKRGAVSIGDATAKLSFEFIGLGKDTAAARQTFKDLAGAAGDQYGQDMANAGYVLKGLKNDAQGLADYQKFWQTAAVGAPQQDPEVLIKEFTRSISIALQTSAAKTNFAQRYTIPGQWGLGLAATPLQPVGQGALSAEYLKATGQTGKAGAIGAEQGVRSGITAEAKADWEKYKSTMVQALGSGPAAAEQKPILDAFNNAALTVEQTGAAIAAQTTIINQAQGHLQALEAQNTKIMSERSLATARGLAGVSGGNELGKLQRSDIMLGQQSTGLGLGLQQRSITTELAVAKFQAPGDTPEIRYARQQEAITKARIAQQQLDISKKQFANQVRETAITTTGGKGAYGLGDAERAATIAAANLTAATDIGLAQGTIADLLLKQQKAQGLLNASIGTAQGVIESVFDVAAQMAATNLLSVADNAEAAAKGLGLFVPAGTIPASSTAGPNAREDRGTATTSSGGRVPGMKSPGGVTVTPSNTSNVTQNLTVNVNGATIQSAADMNLWANKVLTEMSKMLTLSGGRPRSF